ncbi:MAG: NADH-quinone oxidoreductase subunit NuoF [Bdellovibrionales bacterium]|nr:NADH-quinone oxidoreductase subunit NuoF [Bdellovibrionales bacterium]
MEKILSKHFNQVEARAIDVSIANGRYSRVAKALSMKPDEITSVIKESGLRGRGGAGFPTGVKWGFVPKGTQKPVYLCINADESEPGTFKDREILKWDPHLLIEGIIISSYALGCHTCYIYIRGEYNDEALILEKAIDEAYEKKYLGKNIAGKGFDLNVYVHRGAGAYICGEETALLESLEGNRGYPRLKPPFPAVEGLWKCPTIVNNVETIANVGPIIEHGAAWYKQWGSEKCPGTRLFAVSGHVQKPGVYEAANDIRLLDLIEMAGGLRSGRKLKAVIPGGASAPVLPAHLCDIKMDPESIAQAGSMAGSSAVMVLDDSTDMVSACRTLTDFFAHESCGQCTPCREGSPWLAKLIRRIDQGEGKASDLDLLLEITKNAVGRTICVFSEANAAPVQSFIKYFSDEFLARMKHIQPKRESLPVL